MHFAQQLGFSEAKTSAVGVIVTEAGNNLVNHAKDGELLLSTFGECLQILSIDKGPGMNLDACMRDGFSTAGTPGTGLGAIQRMTSLFDGYSLPSGTLLVAGVGKCYDRFGVARAPIKGETLCGDSWSVVDRGESPWILVADGLGHGEFAAAAADRAVETFESSRFDSPSGVVADIHGALRSTRGAAIAVARLKGGSVDYCGLGNIAGVLHSGDSAVHMVSMSGTAGMEARKINQFTYKYSPGAMLIMHSDGLHTQWGLERYPGVMRRHPAILAGLLYRDYTRGRDDVTVLTLRT